MNSFVVEHELHTGILFGVFYLFMYVENIHLNLKHLFVYVLKKLTSEKKFKNNTIIGFVWSTKAQIGKLVTLYMQVVLILPIG